MSAKKVDTTNFDAEVLQSNTPVLVDFWAPWCGPCRMMGPVVDELADELGEKATVVKVNIDDAPEVASRYGIQSIPTFLVFNDGEPSKQFGGVVNKDVLRSEVLSDPSVVN